MRCSPKPGVRTSKGVRGSPKPGVWWSVKPGVRCSPKPGVRWSVKPDGVRWIWFNEGNPPAEAPAETRYFRRTFSVDRPGLKPVEDAALDITADNGFTVWVNGALVFEAEVTGVQL